ncbi:protein ANTAGONIST OF LIKE HETEROCHROMATIN PROTEIN 1-like [Bufo gargarizans]|uniref:protein ANTAGONIST OF LIKE HETEROCHROMATIN PROTEIN 1-like n=1 Tax=Bufo gargarizans TaxID=30331 RepID=UPI001CF3BDEC|nr:protein ANTAGONIST OF LIKE HETEROCHROMATIN PROTEIN 1-like [Bufo gargarizans]
MLEEEPRRTRVHPIFAQRAVKGQFLTMYADLREHPDKFVCYCQMSIPTFDLLLGELRPGLTFMNTNMRRCVSAEERLIITLRFLATGNSFASLHFEFGMGTSTISGIVRATCATMWLRLRAAVLPQPTRQQWLQIAQGFQDRAQFPNCIGALDGKHIQVKKPPNSGPRFYNYKQFFSVVLLALADTNYRFIIVDIGAYGSSADARIFWASRMGRWLQSNQT